MLVDGLNPPEAASAEHHGVEGCCGYRGVETADAGAAASESSVNARRAAVIMISLGEVRMTLLLLPAPAIGSIESGYLNRCGTNRDVFPVTQPSASRMPIPAASCPMIQLPITGRLPSKSGIGASSWKT